MDFNSWQEVGLVMAAPQQHHSAAAHRRSHAPAAQTPACPLPWQSSMQTQT